MEGQQLGQACQSKLACTYALILQLKMACFWVHVVFSQTTSTLCRKQFKLIGPTVKRGASIGANALLFPGITIGEGAVIGSQAMVNADVPPRTIYVGVPARKMRTSTQMTGILHSSKPEETASRMDKY